MSVRKRVGGGGEASAGTFGGAVRLLAQVYERSLVKLAFLAIFVVAVASATAALVPVPLKLLVDELAGPGAPQGDSFTIPLLVIAYAGAHFAARVAGEVRTVIAGRLEERISYRLSLSSFQQVVSLPSDFHDAHPPGGILQGVANGIAGYRLVIQHVLTTILPALLEFSTMSIVMVSLNQSVFLYVIGASLACYMLIFILSSSGLIDAARRISRASVGATSALAEGLLNQESIRTSCAEEVIGRRMSRIYGLVESSAAYFLRTRYRTGLTVTAVFCTSLAACVYLGSTRLQTGEMKVGDFVLVNAYLVQVLRPLEALGFAALDVGRGLALVEGLTALFRLQRERDGGTPDILPPSGPIELRLEHVHLRYGDHNAALHDVSVRIPAGTRAAIVGPSGSGKSSLVRLLLRLREPDSGCIFIDGIPAANLSRATLRSAIALVPQDIALFNDSVSFNIAFGTEEASQQQIRSAARMACVHDVITALPHCYDTVVGNRGMKLSGGERQRIAIARALLRQPRLLIFDEATSALDLATERAIMRCLGTLAGRVTMLIVAHRLTSIVDVDVIYVLNKGQLIEYGTHEELLRRKGLYFSMWAAQRQ